MPEIKSSNGVVHPDSANICKALEAIENVAKERTAGRAGVMVWTAYMEYDHLRVMVPKPNDLAGQGERKLLKALALPANNKIVPLAMLTGLAARPEGDEARRVRDAMFADEVEGRRVRKPQVYMMGLGHGAAVALAVDERFWDYDLWMESAREPSHERVSAKQPTERVRATPIVVDRPAKPAKPADAGTRRTSSERNLVVLEVERKMLDRPFDLRGFASRYGNPVLAVVFQGWGHDPREIHQIPEVQAFCARLLTDDPTSAEILFDEFSSESLFQVGLLGRWAMTAMAIAAAPDRFPPGGPAYRRAGPGWVLQPAAPNWSPKAV